MSGMTDFLASMLRALAQKRILRGHRIGPGEYRTPIYRPRKGDYTGQQLRDIRAAHGVGRRPTDAPNFYLVPQEELTPAQVAERFPVQIGSVRGMTFVKSERVPSFQDDPIGAVEYFGGQRAAAKALGINLSTFQRALKRQRHPELQP